MTAAPADQPGDSSGPGIHLTRIATFGLLVGPLLSMIDSSIVNVAVPDIAKELKATLDEVQRRARSPRRSSC